MQGDDAAGIKLGDDVQIIRNILFGEHLQQLQERIAALEKSISILQKENQKLQQSLQAQSKSGQDNLDSAKALLIEQLQSLEDKINTRLKNDAQFYKKALAELGEEQATQIKQTSEKIAANHHKLNSLISTLAEALIQYQQASPEEG